MEKQFVNGFKSWAETHYFVSAAIEHALDGDNYFFENINKARDIQEADGMFALTELAERLTDKFEEMNEKREWDGEWIEELDDFLIKELYNK